MKQKFAQAVRILTTPPVFSALMCTLLYVIVPGSFASLGHYLLAIVCLSLLPVLAYPVSYLIPALRRGGRADLIEPMTKAVFASTSYEEALAHICEYVEAE